MHIRAAAGGLKARLDQPVLGVVGHALIQPIAQDLATARQNRRQTAKHAIHAHAQIQRNEGLRALQRPDPDLVVVHGALPAQFANSCAERGESGTADVGLQTRGIADLSGGNAEARQWTLQHGQVALAQQIDVHGEVAQPLDTPPLQRERRIGMGRICAVRNITVLGSPIKFKVRSARKETSSWPCTQTSPSNGIAFAPDSGSRAPRSSISWRRDETSATSGCRSSTSAIAVRQPGSSTSSSQRNLR